MSLWQSFLEALESLSSNKLRSALTILGIVIGVAAVIAMVSVGRGAQNTITDSIQGIGTNLLFVIRGGSEDVRNPKPITLGDAEAIADPFQAPSVGAVAPVLQGSAEITFGGEGTTTSIMGVTPDYEYVRNYQVAEGEFINEEHMLGQASVVLLGPEVAKEIVRIEGQPFRVIGVLEAKGGSGFSNVDDQAFVPFSTAQTRLIRRSANDRVDMLIVSAVDAGSVPEASEEIAQILRTRCAPATERKSGRTISRS